ncbi:MAG TPA: PAS domain S-box protein, partial [Ktedonobacterales bacterium]
MENALNSEESHYPAGYLGSDIAGQVAHTAAESPEDAFRTTVELTASGICHIDPAGRLLYVNPALCQLTRFSREELLGLSIPDILDPVDVAETVDDLRRLITGE